VTLRLGWFSTGRGPGSRRLLATVHEEIAAGRLDASIEVVFCNREPGQDPQTDQFFEQVRGYGLPLVYLSTLRFRRDRGERPAPAAGPLPEWRRDFDREVIGLLEPYPFELGVLAGYMLIATDVMCERYDLLNLHPAAPDGPPGTWQEVIWWLIERGADHSGVRIHLATTELDMGPPVAYCTYPLRGPGLDELWREVERRGAAAVRAQDGEENALFKTIREHGVARELPLVVETLRAFAEGRVRIAGKRIVDAEGREIAGYDLTDEIERIVARQEPPV
jgi:folate-dependent phosphoribosylglycinamide formyltransferase PurN